MDGIKNLISAISDTALLGTIVNTLAVIIGAGVGITLKRGIPERIEDTVTKGLALCVLMIGLQGMMKGENTLVTILSIVLGGLLGELLRIDDGMNRLGKYVEAKFKNGSDSKIAEGFVTASLLFIVGAMAVVGSLQSGLMHDHTTIYAKSILDGVSSVIFASTLGLGVMLSSVAVFVYQGAITLFAGVLAPVLNDTVIAEMTAAGSVIIFGLGLNMIGLTRIKVANYLPAIFLPILFCLFI